MLDDQLQQRLDNEPWNDHLETLTLYAHNLIRKLSWRGELNGAVPGGKEAQDFAGDVIFDVYSGIRKWNPETHPDLLRFLLAAVRSEVSNAVTKKSNQERRDDPNRPEAGIFDDNTALALLDYVQDDPSLYRYVEAIFDGHDNRADIAQHLSIDVTDVDNLRRKMRRRLDSFYREA